MDRQPLWKYFNLTLVRIRGNIFFNEKDYRKWYKVQPVGEGPFNAKQYHTAVVRGECIFMVGGAGEGIADIDYLCVGRDDFEEEFEADGISIKGN